MSWQEEFDKQTEGKSSWEKLTIAQAGAKFCVEAMERYYFEAHGLCGQTWQPCENGARFVCELRVGHDGKHEGRAR